MKSTEKLAELGKELLAELYANCEPPLDFKEATEEGGKATQEGDHPNWFMEHYISDEDETRIRDAFAKKNQLNANDIRKLDWLMLDIGPTNSREAMLRERAVFKETA